MTEIDSHILMLEAQGFSPPETPTELMAHKAEVLDLLVNEQLVLQDAARDSTIAVTDEELEERLELEIAGQVRQFGTLARLQDALAAQHMTMSVFRDQRRNAIKRQLLRERYMAKQGPVAVGYLRRRGGAEVLFRGKPGAVARSATHDPLPEPPTAARADRFRKSGGAFGGGQRPPEDPRRFLAGVRGSCEAVLGRTFGQRRRRARLDPPRWQLRRGIRRRRVRAVARHGECAGRERTSASHLIYVERVRGGERRVRHILFQPEITETDIQANLHRADGFRSRILAGEDIEELSGRTGRHARTHHRRDQPDLVNLCPGSSGRRGRRRPRPRLRFEDPQSPNTVGIVRVLEIKGGGALGFEDVRDQIEARLKSEKLTEEVVEALRGAARSSTSASPQRVDSGRRSCQQAVSQSLSVIPGASDREIVKKALRGPAGPVLPGQFG